MYQTLRNKIGIAVAAALLSQGAATAQCTNWNLVGNAGFSMQSATEGQIVIDATGVPHVIFAQGANNQPTCMKYTAPNWTTLGGGGGPMGGGISFTPCNFATMAFDNTNVPYAVYVDVINGYKAVVKKYVGTAWTNVGPATGFSAGPASTTNIAMDATGTPYVVYQDQNNLNYKATCMKYNGTAWVPVGTAAFTPGQADYTRIAIDASGTIYVAYSDGTNSQKMSVMKFNGTAWANVGTPGFSAGQAGYVSLALDPSGKPYVGYIDYSLGQKPAVMKYNGTSWVSVGTAGLSTGTSTYTSLAIDGGGNPYLSFTDNALNNKITVKKYDGVNWVTAGTAGFSTGSALYTSIAIDGTGTPYVMYKDSAVQQKATVQKLVQTVSALPGTNPVICAGVTSANLPYTVSNGTPTVYSITWSAAALSAGFVNVVNAPITTSPLSFTIPAGAAAGVYNASLSVGDGTCTGLGSGFTVTLNPSTAPTTTITASPAGTICAGTAVTYTTNVTNGGTTPTYQWIVNGANVGSSTTTYTFTPGNNDSVRCVVTSSGACSVPASASSNSIIAVVTTPAVPTNTISASPAGAVCAGTSVTFTAATTNGGGTPTYQWIKNGANVGTNTNSYTYTPANGDSVRCVLTSSISCVSPGVLSSNTINMVVNPIQVPTNSIASNAGTTICTGTSVTFTATPTNGGANPTYQWYVNGSPVGTGSTYSYLPNDLDSVRCVVTSNATCASPANASSNALYMTVSSSITPTVTINVSPNDTVCAGTAVSLTAVAVGGGTTPTYQWVKNGSNVGTNSSTYGYTPVTGDVIHCEYTSSATCASPTAATSSNITMVVNPVYTPTITIAAPANAAVGTTVNVTATVANAGSSYTIYWMKSGVVFATTTVPPASGNATSYTKGATDDTLTAKVLVNGPCPDSTTSITAVVTTITVGVGYVTYTNDLQVYPNPANGVLHIQYATNGVYHIMNLMGATLQQGTLQTGNNEVALTSLPAGIYMLTVTDVAGTRQVVRVVKE